MSDVIDYETGEELKGAAGPDLLRESQMAGGVGTGAVPAYLDESGLWQYVRPEDVEHYRRNLGIAVRTVYVREDPPAWEETTTEIGGQTYRTKTLTTGAFRGVTMAEVGSEWVGLPAVRRQLAESNEDLRAAIAMCVETLQTGYGLTPKEAAQVVAQVARNVSQEVG